MKILPSIAILGLVLTIVPPAIHLLSDLSHSATLVMMTVGMVVWYCAAIPWLILKK